jgi:hypothetical protein
MATHKKGESKSMCFCLQLYGLFLSSSIPTMAGICAPSNYMTAPKSFGYGAPWLRASI